MVAEAVNSAKELAVAAVSKQVADFTIIHLKDYVSKFFKSLLKNEDVAPFSEIQAIHKWLEQVKHAHKSLISKITASASSANKAEDVMRADISSLLSSRDKMKQQINSL